MIIIGISDPSSQNISQIERQANAQVNTQTSPQNPTQAGRDKDFVSITESKAGHTAHPKAENSSVNLSPESIKLQTQSGSTQIPDTDKLVGPASAKDTAEKEKADLSGGVKSFAYGALGMDHPDKVQEKEDDSYTAGQYLKAAATIGSVIALFV